MPAPRRPREATTGCGCVVHGHDASPRARTMIRAGARPAACDRSRQSTVAVTSPDGTSGGHGRAERRPRPRTARGRRSIVVAMAQRCNSRQTARPGAPFRPGGACASCSSLVPVRRAAQPRHQAPALIVLSRAFMSAWRSSSCFGLFEQWPRRLPRWLSRWGLQVLAVAACVVVRFARAVCDLGHAGRRPAAGHEQAAMDGYAQLSASALSCSRRGLRSAR